MTPRTVLLFALGLLLLIGGAEILVRGSRSLALRLSMSPLLVGLTVVSLGTSAPEIAVSVDAARSGVGSLAIGNLVGSNIFNVLCVLGLAGLAAPLVVPSRLVRLDVPFMIVATLAAVALAADGALAAWDGAMLLALAVGYVALLVRASRSEGDAPAPEAGDLSGDALPRAGAAGLARDAALIVAGLGLLVLGSRWLVRSAVAFAQAADVSPAVVGLTVVAIGTPLPELATSVVASLRGARDLAVGNVVGSNVSNLLLVLGVAVAAAPGRQIAVPARTLAVDLPVMLAAALACLPIFFTGHRISRWEAGLFLAYYAAYLTFLVLDATGHQAEHPFVIALLGFVVPLTLITLAVVLYREVRDRGPRA